MLGDNSGPHCEPTSYITKQDNKAVYSRPLLCSYLEYFLVSVMPDKSIVN